MTSLPPILTTKTLTVPLGVADAFRLFTAGMATWWPTGGTRLRMEPFKGGDIIETAADGRSEVRGTVLAFDPAGFLAFTWYPAHCPDAATIVTVAFTTTPEGCRVDLTHGSEALLGGLADAVSTSYLRGCRLVKGSYCGCAPAMCAVA